MQKFGLSDSLLDAAKAVLQGKQPAEPVVEEKPVEEKPQSLDEKKHLDPVGQEDSDVDNDGDVDSSDKYLKKRRKAISKAIAKEDVEQVDELSRETLGSYSAKASDARGHKGLSTKKVDNRYTGVARAADKLDKKNREAVEEIAPAADGLAALTARRLDRDKKLRNKSDSVEEDMSVHLSMNKDGKSYTVKKEKTGGRLKKGESISDTHVDDLKDSGVKVHHEEVEQGDMITEEMVDFLIEMSDEEFEELINESTQEELDEILGALARGAGNLIKKGVQAGAQRMSVQGRADAAERKTEKLAAKTQKVQDKMAARKKLGQQKAAAGLAKQKLQATKAKAKAQKKAMKAGGVTAAAASMESVEVEEGAMKRMATQDQLGLGGTGLKSFKKVTADRNKMKTQPQNSSVDFAKDHRAISTKEEVEDVEEMGSYKLPTALQQPKKKNGKNGSMPVKEDTELDEGIGDELVRSAKQASNFAKHYYAKSKELAKQGMDTMAAKAMSVAKKFYRKSEADEKKEKGGKQETASERYELENLGAGEIYWSEEEIAEIMAADDLPEFDSVDEAAPMPTPQQKAGADRIRAAIAKKNENDADRYSHHRQGDMKAAIKAKMKERGLAKEEAEEVEEAEEQKPLNVKRDALGGPKLDPSKGVSTVSEARKGGGAKVGESERSGHRVTKAGKSEPEHIVMQLRKVVSLGKKHEGVKFANGETKKVHPNVASAALNRYNKSKSGDKEEMQRHMDHSHGALSHIAGGHALSKSPAAKKKDSGLSLKSDPTQLKRHGVASKSGHYN